MTGTLGLALLSAYGAVTAVAGVASLRRGNDGGLPRIQAAVFGLIGIAIAIAAILSRGHALVWIAGLGVLSLLSRVWNGTKMAGGARPSHLVLFGGILALGTALAYIK
jgi:hypothetical protein